jgi:polysaccharide biosynthesis/export protein
MRAHFILPCLLLWAALAGAASNDYQLGAADLLRITVFNYPDLSAEVRVSESGNITFPLIGQVAVKGLSTRDVETLLTSRLSEGGFINRAQVTVLVSEYQSQKISVMGQVAKPGQYALTQANKVLDLLAAAGGLIGASAGEQATLLRKDGTKQPIDLSALFDGDPAQNPVVSGGDTIFVPRAPQFYVYGEVQRPGVYRLERNMSVSQALSTGGGLTARGSERRIVIKRRDAKGKERTISADGSGFIQPDDVLYVKESLF